MNLLEKLRSDVLEHIRNLDESMLSNTPPKAISRVLAKILEFDTDLFVMYTEFTYWDPGLSKPTAGVAPASDGRHLIFSYNEAWFNSLNYNQLFFLLIHEAGHILREHHGRAEAMGVTNETHEIANIAMDVWINQDIAQEGSFDFTPEPPFDVYAFDAPAEHYGDISESVAKWIKEGTGKDFTEKYTGPHSTEPLYEWILLKLKENGMDPTEPPPEQEILPEIGDIVRNEDGTYGEVIEIDSTGRKVKKIRKMSEQEAHRKVREQAGLDKGRIQNMMRSGEYEPN